MVKIADLQAPTALHRDFCVTVTLVLRSRALTIYTHTHTKELKCGDTRLPPDGDDIVLAVLRAVQLICIGLVL